MLVTSATEAAEVKASGQHLSWTTKKKTSWPTYAMTHSKSLHGEKGSMKFLSCLVEPMFTEWKSTKHIIFRPCSTCCWFSISGDTTQVTRETRYLSGGSFQGLMGSRITDYVHISSLILILFSFRRFLIVNRIFLLACRDDWVHSVGLRYQRPLA